MPRCQCLTEKGRQCFRNAKEGSIYCFQHVDCKKIKKKSKIKVNKLAINFKTKTFKKYSKPNYIVLLGTAVNLRGVDVINLSASEISLGLRVGGKKELLLETTGRLSILEHHEFKDWLEGPNYVDLSTISAILLENFVGNIEVGVQLADSSYTDNFEFDNFIKNQFDDQVDIFINLPEGTTFTQLH